MADAASELVRELLAAEIAKALRPHVDHMAARLDDMQRALADVEAKGAGGGNAELARQVQRHSEHLARMQTALTELKSKVLR